MYVTEETRKKSEELTIKCSCLKIELEFTVLVDVEGGKRPCMRGENPGLGAA